MCYVSKPRGYTRKVAGTGKGEEESVLRTTQEAAREGGRFEITAMFIQREQVSPSPHSTKLFSPIIFGQKVFSHVHGSWTGGKRNQGR